MPLIGAWMHGNAFHTLINTQLSMVNNIGVVALSRVSYQCDFIEIDAQGSHNWYRLTNGNRFLIRSDLGLWFCQGRPGFWVDQPSAKNTGGLNGYVGVHSQSLGF